MMDIALFAGGLLPPSLHSLGYMTVLGPGWSNPSSGAVSWGAVVMTHFASAFLRPHLRGQTKQVSETWSIDAKVVVMCRADLRWRPRFDIIGRFIVILAQCVHAQS